MSVAGGNFSQLAEIGCSVGELIEALKVYDATVLVVLPGQNAGFVGVQGARPLKLRLFCNSMPDFGPHEEPGRGEMADIAAVALLPAG